MMPWYISDNYAITLNSSTGVVINMPHATKLVACATKSVARATKSVARATKLVACATESVACATKFVARCYKIMHAWI